MKVVELRRHGPRAKDADALSPGGLELVRRVAATLPGAYTSFVTSGAARATQTLREWASPPEVETEPGLLSEAEDRWRAAGKAAGSSHLDAIREHDPDLVQREVQRLAGVVSDLARRLPEGTRALAVGHSPLIEAAVAGLTGRVIEPLAECDGVALTFEDDRVTRVEELRP